MCFYDDLCFLSLIIFVLIVPLWRKFLSARVIHHRPSTVKSENEKQFSTRTCSSVSATTDPQHKTKASTATASARNSSLLQTPPQVPFTVVSARKQQHTSQSVPGHKSTRTTANPVVSSHEKKSRSPLQVISHQSSSAKTKSLDQKLSSNHSSDNSSNDGCNTRRNLDKRTARLQYSSDFEQAIDKIRAEESLQGAFSSPVSKNDQRRDVSIFVRKRVSKRHFVFWCRLMFAVQVVI